ncbi:hypothetical protein M885DRAFT_538858 [Pelagophyceae sp. CCMP2097]|jgi:hypothetical protein|nr:hypothetical protein M885DRAFT_538858 [Pelagophyceae sp. CCMP2097]
MGLSSALLCLSVGASALSLQRAPLRTAKRAPARGRVTMEDFGLMAGTQFSFRDEWRVDANSGRMMDCISEVKIERYMNYHGRRHKMNKTAQERKDNNLKLGGEPRRRAREGDRDKPSVARPRRGPEAAKVSATRRGRRKGRAAGHPCKVRLC